ncbi:DNA-processing protein DprA [Aliibacillus thermotolerans]|uniref:DNA-processing protein DprA n=1 Tax=Aliibacillus thermotolerans TaxID=1834418 RepID=A0ABW0U5P0_9BACI|nr:DNA-processing protein DprA [Aliibacillus thermotolerans]MDA3130626.1 DNA-protecting protein DprA [Aliibacillus thermotolerans]
MDRNTALLHLSEAPFMNWKRLNEIYQHDPSFLLPYHLSKQKLLTLLRLTPPEVTKLYHYLHETSPYELEKRYEQTPNLHIVTRFDPIYPDRLQHIYDPPWVLYVSGNLSFLSSPYTLAVVGSRTPTEYGKKAIRTLLPPLIQKQVTIISGVAKGTDTFAHQTAIQWNGTTIGVLGSGFAHMYPRENQALSEHMAKEQLLLSEYPPSTPPRKWQFPMRNRIISGLSDVVFLTEAQERSGSLITAYQALEQGKEVGVLPGSIFSPLSKGTHQLLSEGAFPVWKSEHLYHERWSIFDKNGIK